jgi:hypothetical protein
LIIGVRKPGSAMRTSRQSTFHQSVSPEQSFVTAIFVSYRFFSGVAS